MDGLQAEARLAVSRDISRRGAVGQPAGVPRVLADDRRRATVLHARGAVSGARDADPVPPQRGDVRQFLARSALHETDGQPLRRSHDRESRKLLSAAEYLLARWI